MSGRRCRATVGTSAGRSRCTHSSHGSNTARSGGRIGLGSQVQAHVSVKRQAVGSRRTDGCCVLMWDFILNFDEKVLQWMPSIRFGGHHTRRERRRSRQAVSCDGKRSQQFGTEDVGCPCGRNHASSVLFSEVFGV